MLRPRSIVFISRVFLFMIGLSLIVTGIIGFAQGQGVHDFIVVKIDTEITYGTAYLVQEAISEGERLDAPVIIILDTPGGLLAAAQQIIEYIRNSNVPVIGYVYPVGAAAWSAGTLILMATHIAAMAPGTNIGAVQPVLYNPTTGEYQPLNMSKVVNPVVSMITTLAQDRGRNVTAARDFVLHDLTLNDQQALKYHVIEVIARNIDDLLAKINGWKVKLDNGREYVISSSNAHVIYYSGSIRVAIVSAVSDPIVNSLLMTIGVLTLIFSILSGHILFVPIAIALIIISLLGMGFNPNTISLILLVIGAIALAIEIHTPGFGVLGFTGIVLIALSIALLPVLNPGWLVAPSYQKTLFWTGISIGVVLGIFMGIVLYKVLKVKLQPPKLKTLPLGTIGKAIDDIPPGGQGFVLIEGEYWKATSDEEIKKGDKVVVIGKEGPILKVRKLVEEK